LATTGAGCGLRPRGGNGGTNSRMCLRVHGRTLQALKTRWNAVVWWRHAGISGDSRSSRDRVTRNERDAMFILMFPPPATGWLDPIDDAESIEGVKSHGRKWVHIAARATVAAVSPAPGKEIGGSVWARVGRHEGRGCGSLRRLAIRLSRSVTSLLLRVRLPASPLTGEGSSVT
jgi:hypothetical protein